MPLHASPEGEERRGDKNKVDRVVVYQPEGEHPVPWRGWVLMMEEMKGRKKMKKVGV